MTKEIEKQPFHMCMRAWRKSVDMSRATLASKSGISLSMIEKIETGDRSPSVGVLLCLLRAMNMDHCNVLAQVDLPASQKVWNQKHTKS